MALVSDELVRRWMTGRHVGGYRPAQVVRIRQGQFNRGYTDWSGEPINAKIPGETQSKPWQATWTPTSAWKELPNITECRLEQDLSANGIAQATITLTNVLMTPNNTPMGILYHAIDRGALAPYRGYNAPGMSPWNYSTNEWYDIITKDAQIWIQQGYGADVMSHTFTGLIDSVDPVSPGLLTLTIRDFGKVLTEERLFGWVDGPKVVDPVTFTAKDPNKLGASDPVGFNAEASSERDGHPARFVLVVDKTSEWISEDHDHADVTEWIEVHLPKGKYESFHIHPGYPNMEVYVGVYARDELLGGEPAQMDDVDVVNGWLTVPADEGGGVVPGTNGGWPYLKMWTTMTDAKKSYPLDHTLELGNNSVLRVGFRNLYHIGNGIHRAGAIRLAGNHLKSTRTIILRLVGKDADSSSDRDGYPAKNVLDESTATPWISQDHEHPDVTEWVEIHLPQGRYDSFQIHTDYTNLKMYVGIYARNRKRKKAKGKGYEAVPAQVDDQDLPITDNGFWVRLKDDQGNPLPDVPGDYGGWPYVVYWTGVGPQPKSQPETFSFGHKFELGDDSVLRVGFRDLMGINGKYRASVNKLKARTRTGVKQPDPPPDDVQKIEVDDPSDIIRIVLRWAGFKEWEIENTGAKLKGDWVFNRQTYLIDIIKKVAEATGFVFYVGAPSDDDLSIGVPIFRSSYLLRDDMEFATVRDTDMLTAVQAHFTEEPLGYIIRVRGAADDKGAILGSDSTKKLMSVYKPPWWTRLAGIIKHVVTEMPRLEDQKSVDVAARLIAVQQALASATATIEIAGMPGFELDGQVGLWDTATGLKTRLYIARTTSTFAAGKQASWKATIGGALLDTPDIVMAKQDLFALVPPSSGVPALGGDVDGS